MPENFLVWDEMDNSEIKKQFQRAIDNVISYGDTDIFPFPIENFILRDKKEEIIKLLVEMHNNFDKYLASMPPQNVQSIIPVNYTGFRIGNQLDSIWNVYFLGLVLSISEEIERQRISKTEDSVFSYRFSWDEANKSIFDEEYNWRKFMISSTELAQKHKYVVICDVAEFYYRIGHHRLENALAHMNLTSDIPQKIMKFLSNFSNTNSFGLPVGGAAARILSELGINQIDQLLKLDGVKFNRYSDDFHIFVSSIDEGYSRLLYLTEKLQRNQGLQLQKAKTRIMSSQEFISTSPVQNFNEAEVGDEIESEEKAKKIFFFKVKFDPYSPTSEDDYEELKKEVRQLDIIGVLQTEISKSRIHIALSKKILHLIQHLNQRQKERAVTSILENLELFFPVFGTILQVFRQIIKDLPNDMQASIIDKVSDLLIQDSYLTHVEIFLVNSIRLISIKPSQKTQEIMARIYSNPRNEPYVRREVILAMGRVNAWHWLSDRRASFSSMTAGERRAFIIASFFLKDEGSHWRKNIKAQFNDFEKIVCEWAGQQKSSKQDWSIPT